MSRHAARLVKFGFEPRQLSYAGRTALAACAALSLAWWAGLEHPQWAAMTVWAASQPTRGQLLEKGFFRIAGTISGSVAGVLLVLAGAISPWLLVTGLALWVAACTGIGNLQRGYVSYGTVLAGYTAAMVALLDASHPEQVLGLGADRLATVLTGVLVAMLFGYVFAPPTANPELRRRTAGLIADSLEVLAARLQGETTRPGQGGVFLAEIAGIEEALEPQAAGSIRSRRVVRSTRALLGEGLSLVLWLRRHRDEATAPDLSAPLAAAVAALRAGEAVHARTELAAAAAALGGAEPRLKQILTDLGAALLAWHDPGRAATERPLPVVVSRDWIGAREASLRAGGAILLFGAVWQLTQWQAGPFLLLGLSIMISLFSTFENPRAMMRNVFWGSLFGALGALACRWLVWPWAAADWQLIALCFPFILFGPFLVGHRRTTAMSFDYNMTLMLMLQPAWPLAGAFGASLEVGLAILAAPLAAYLAYRLIYPAGLRRRQRMQLVMMLHDLAALAGDDRALAHRPVWRARLYHRCLRLVRLSQKAVRSEDWGARVGFAMMDLGHAVLRAKELQRTPGLDATQARVLAGFMARIGQLPERPERCLAALERLARRMAPQDRRPFRRAADELALLIEEISDIGAQRPVAGQS
ncbi:FUSC family protein [Rhodobacter lacus]|uniref:FUSC family protein n=1 Tax=Rhodobacter lacus TaxID=1641972 RepID=A0ABW5A6B2_9RHOB